MTEKYYFHSFPSWLLGDHLGSTSMTANANGTFLSEARYSAFGEIRYQNGTLTTDYLYTGQRQEAEVGLYYYVARWYDPAIGRFIQADSVVPDPGSALGYDRFAYAANNPIRYNDPSGHCFSDPFSLFICALVGGAVVSGAVNAYNQYQELGSVDIGQVAEAAVGGALITGGAVIAGVGVVTVGSGVLAVTGIATTAGGALVADGDPTNEIAGAISIVGDPSDEISAFAGIVGDPSDEIALIGDPSDEIQTATHALDNLITQSGKPVTSTSSQAIYQPQGGLNSALSNLQSTLGNNQVVQEVENGVFVGKFPGGGNITFRPTSSVTQSWGSTPTLDFNKVPGYLNNLKFHFQK